MQFENNKSIAYDAHIYEPINRLKDLKKEIYKQIVHSFHQLLPDTANHPLFKCYFGSVIKWQQQTIMLCDKSNLVLPKL